MAIEVPSDEPVALRAAKRLGKDLVGDAIQRVVEILVAPASTSQLSQYRKRPATCQQAYEHVGSLMLVHYRAPRRSRPSELEIIGICL